MELGITIPLQKFLKVRRPEPGTCPDPFLCWDVHRVKLGDGHVVMVLTNSANRFLAATRMTASMWRTWDRECLYEIGAALAVAEFSKQTIQAYFDMAMADGVTVTRTHGRKAVGCLNRAIDDIWFDEVDMGITTQPGLCYHANRIICHCPTRKDYIMSATEAFREDLAAHGIR